MEFKRICVLLLFYAVTSVSSKPPEFNLHKIETNQNDIAAGQKTIPTFSSSFLGKFFQRRLSSLALDKGRLGRSVPDHPLSNLHGNPSNVLEDDALDQEETIGIRFEPASTNVPENTDVEIHVTVTCPTCMDVAIISVHAEVLDENLAVISPAEQNMTSRDEDGARIYSATFNVTAKFLGVTAISFRFGYMHDNGDVTPNYYAFNGYRLNVERIRNILDIIFDYSMQVLLVISTATFGCELDLQLMRKYFKRPVGVVVGLLCQYGIMPSLVLLFDYILDIPTFIDYGLLAYASCPGGGASNIYTSLLGGEINLSITMTFMSTVASLAFMPMWMYTAGTSLTGSDAQIPFMNIFTGLLMIIIPVFVGIAMKRFIPKFAEIFVKVLRPVSVVGVLFLTGAGFYINFYIIEIVIDLGWTVAVPSMILPWLGIMIAMLVAFIIRQPWHRCKTIGIETGVQNMPLAVLLLRSSLQSPASQLSAVGPVVAGLATPIPIIIAILLRFCYLRHKGVIVNEDKAGDDESMDGEIDEEAEQVMDYKLRRLSMLVRRASMFVAGRNRSDTTDTTLSSTTYALNGRLRSNTADTMLDDFTRSGRSSMRSRANTVDTDLGSGSDSESDTVFETDSQFGVRSDVDRHTHTVRTTDALPGIYRGRSDTMDTILSDAPMISRMHSRSRSDTVDTFLNDSPKVARKTEMENAIESSPSALKMSSSSKPPSIMRAKPLNNTTKVSDHVADGGTPGTFRHSQNSDNVSFSPIIYRKSFKLNDTQKKATLAPSSEPTMTDSQEALHLKRSRAMKAILVNDRPYSNGREGEDDMAETSLTEPSPNRGNLHRTDSTTSPSPRSSDYRSSTSTDTGIGSDFRSSYASSRRRSLSLSSLDTISAYVETRGDDSVLSVIHMEEDLKQRGLQEGSRTTRAISSALDVEKSPLHSTIKKNLHRSSTSDIPTSAGVEDTQDIPRESKSASRNLYKLLNKSRVWKLNEQQKRTKSNSINESNAHEETPSVPNGRF